MPADGGCQKWVPVEEGGVESGRMRIWWGGLSEVDTCRQEEGGLPKWTIADRELGACQMWTPGDRGVGVEGKCQRPQKEFKIAKFTKNLLISFTN